MRTQGNVLAPCELDEVLDPVDDGHRSVRVELSDVSSLEPPAFGKRLIVQIRSLWESRVTKIRSRCALATSEDDTDFEVALEERRSSAVDLSLGSLVGRQVARIRNVDELDLHGL